MKIAVLANGLLKEEMQQKIAGAHLSVAWAESVDGLFEMHDADAYFDLDFTFDVNHIVQLGKLFPKPVFINSVVHTLSKINHPFIRINAWAGFFTRNICEAAVQEQAQKNVAEKIFKEMKWDFQFVPDLPGMVSARIVAMIVNEAYYVLEDHVSTKEQIDIAMKLGTNYPFGPFEWSEKIGLKNICDLLQELSKTEGRYTICEALLKDSSK
ncbi:MAG TPA: 3-hydroxyacyl-CoA dehydrogenase family protein [Puia sp.]|nr:3-hydroxyacyl-CoA dehydrogenase family protein [Puia sp.]